MKGIVDFLEKAGLVTKDEPQVPPVPPVNDIDGGAGVGAAGAGSLDFSLGDGTPLKFGAIYASRGIGASLYPAERLLRLIDGLSAMDEATRLMAIKAMDAADESWTIDDPLADAAAKVKALAKHAERLQLNLQKTEQDTRQRLDAVAARQEKVLADIHTQIAELEALAAREQERAAQESAEQEAGLKAVRDQAAQELAQIAQASQRLPGLSLQFGAAVTTTKE